MIKKLLSFGFAVFVLILILFPKYVTANSSPQLLAQNPICFCGYWSTSLNRCVSTGCPADGSQRCPEGTSYDPQTQICKQGDTSGGNTGSGTTGTGTTPPEQPTTSGSGIPDSSLNPGWNIVTSPTTITYNQWHDPRTVWVSDGQGGVRQLRQGETVQPGQAVWINYNWGPVPPPAGTSPNPPTTDTTGSGTYCTSTQLSQGIACKIQNANAGCGCPPEWTCNHLGRQNADGSQTIQCTPSDQGDGIAEGQACSPGGAPCANIIGQDGKLYEATCQTNRRGYRCVSTGTVISNPTQQTGNDNNDGNSGISGGNINDPKFCWNDSNCNGGKCDMRYKIAGLCKAADPSPSEAPAQLTCDPVGNGKIDEADFELWKKEYTKEVNTTKTACLSPNNKVDLLGFQAWKDIFIHKVKQAF